MDLQIILGTMIDESFCSETSKALEEKERIGDATWECTVAFQAEKNNVSIVKQRRRRKYREVGELNPKLRIHKYIFP
jgi:hypothetical protein